MPYIEVFLWLGHLGRDGVRICHMDQVYKTPFSGGGPVFRISIGVRNGHRRSEESTISDRDGLWIVSGKNESF